MIGDYLNAKVVEIKPTKPYPNDYNACLEMSIMELIQQEKPFYEIMDIDLTEYNDIIIGYPNWWGFYPMVVSHFLEEQDLENKRVFPFCAHEGSGFGRSIIDLIEICPFSIIEQGLAIYGSKARRANKAIENWISTIEHK